MIIQNHLTFNRDIIISQLNERLRGPVAKYGQMLAVILRVFRSSQSVDVDKYKQYCMALYINIVTEFIVSPTLHKLLAHSWELISLNYGEGLERLDESGLEGCNKILRTIRSRQARKISQQACNMDCLSRMWVGSDPMLQQERMAALPFCKHCQIKGHGTRYCAVKNPKQGHVGKEDDLVNSLLLITEDDVYVIIPIVCRFHYFFLLIISMKWFLLAK